ncbi:substrate-binding domain-containing protein [Roseospirillum parvum]|uniref:Autoinducer 2-binding protein LuxP n=1 Tax=Roseospirillum parvum TaxID=83401 RepID=A0A1G7YLZ3_9PROT|nr:substrate-binding domain-containing protein [Roseospirillum parvum]SDG96840.1 autoinducer 2-binding protein LuxP [Roseospirillum parvum]
MPGVLALLLVLSPATPAPAQEFAAQVHDLEHYLGLEPGRRAISEGFAAQVAADTPPVVAALPPSPLRIAIIYPGNQVSDYWRRSVAALTARLEQSGLPYTLDSHFTAAGTEVRRQEAYIMEALDHDPDYMVFTLDALRHKTIIERIIGRGGTRLILQNITTPLKDWEGYQPFLYVGFDHATGARMLADHLIERTGGQGSYAVFYGPPGYVSQMRGDTFIRHIESGSDLELQATYYVGFDRAKARRAALDLLRESPDTSFVYACSTDIALGVADAIAELGLGDRVLVNGWGGGSAELAALAAGDLNVTVLRMNDDNGVAMADAIALAESGRAGQVPTVFAGQMALVTEQTDAATLAALTRHAFRYSDPETAAPSERP